MTQRSTSIGRTARRLTILAIGLLFTATGTAAAHGGSYGGGGMMGGGSGLFGGTMGLWGLLWMGLLVAVPAYLLYTFVSRDRGERAPRFDSRNREERAERPLSILRERYARGELSEEEFDRRRERVHRTD